MKSINEYFLTEPNHQKPKGERTDEVISLLLASSLLAFACAPLFNSEVGKGIVGFFAGLGNLFGSFSSKDDKKDDKKDSTTDEESNENALASKNFMAILQLAKKSNDKEKDETAKKENESMIKLLTACSFDKDGNEVPFEERINKMKDALPAGTDFEEFKKKMNDQYEKVKDDPEFKKQMEKAGADIKQSDYDKFINDAKNEAKSSWAQIEKEKAEQKEIDEKIKAIQAEIDGKPTSEQEKQLTQLNDKKAELVTNSTFGGVPGAAAAATSKVPIETQEKIDKEQQEMLKARQDIVKEQDALTDEVDKLEKELETASDDKKEEIQKQIDEKNEAIKKCDDRINAIADIEKKAAEDADAIKKAYDDGNVDAIKKAEEDFANNSKSRTEEVTKNNTPKAEPKKDEPEPTKKPEDYNNDEIDALQNELSDLDPEKDKDKIKEKEDLLKSISKAKGKDENELIPQIDKDKDGKAIQKKTGPRGGKYYRTKSDTGWGEWTNYTKSSQLPESLSSPRQILNDKYMPLKVYMLRITGCLKDVEM